MGPRLVWRGFFFVFLFTEWLSPLFLRQLGFWWWLALFLWWLGFWSWPRFFSGLAALEAAPKTLSSPVKPRWCRGGVWFAAGVGLEGGWARGGSARCGLGFVCLLLLVFC